MSTSDNAFQEVARIFSIRENRILEIEILPPALGPLLQDECSIGITKKYLVQAFVAARRIFFESTKPNPERSSSHAAAQGEKEFPTPSHSDKTLDDLLTSSEIILLFDCEHLTACNWRRRRLEILKQRHDAFSDDRAPLIQALETELSLMTTYLCSPLHRHTKSPTLFQHRLWVFNQIFQVRSAEAIVTQPQKARSASRGTQREQASEEPENTVGLLKSELAIVLRAGELHPRNYYAFSYMRQVYSMLSGAMKKVPGGPSLLAESIIDSMLNWCLAHPSDISGWMFMLYLLEAVPEGDFRPNAVDKVVRFALDVGWEGESLWTFVDLSVRAFGLEMTTRDILQTFSWFTSTAPAVLDDGIGKETPASQNHWKTWLAMARAYWAGHDKVAQPTDEQQQ
ncbi:hypothetical protein BBP40_006057 [Aspergillus hancockii]|nr:hypothetical protein BBP40_006057 [Aspergillus hancockii]